MAKAVYCIAATREQAADIIETLRKAGFSQNAISVLIPDQETGPGLGVEKQTKALEGTAAGASAGGVLGGVLGLLAGIGTLAIPGVGPLLAAGPLLATFSGMGLGASVGGLAGGLIGLGIPEFEAKRYEGRLGEGHILLSVHCEDAQEIERARNIFNASGASDISISQEAAA
jgi:hypothetical protein